MRLEIEIPNEHLISAIQHARIHYWGFWEKFQPSFKDSLMIIEHNGVTNGETAEHTLYRFDLGDIRAALYLMVSFTVGDKRKRRPYLDNFARIVANEASACDGDLLLQLAIFKQEKYA